jgi:hypothetical protein
MISRKLPLALAFSSLSLFLVVAQPAAAIFPENRAGFGAGLWVEMVARLGDLFGRIGTGSHTDERPSQVVANAGSVITPDGVPSEAGPGSGLPPAESH